MSKNGGARWLELSTSFTCPDYDRMNKSMERLSCMESKTIEKCCWSGHNPGGSDCDRLRDVVLRLKATARGRPVNMPEGGENQAMELVSRRQQSLRQVLQVLKCASS